MGRLLVKPGVEFGESLAPAGARILETLKELARGYSFNITITSARDGQHSGPADPHHSGEAFDLRVKGLNSAQIALLLNDLRAGLGPAFYSFHEAPGTANAHIHVQRAKGTTYRISDYLRNA